MMPITRPYKEPVTAGATPARGRYALLAEVPFSTLGGMVQTKFFTTETEARNAYSEERLRRRKVLIDLLHSDLIKDKLCFLEQSPGKGLFLNSDQEICKYILNA